jgi:serine phosphatase RsbU (regulator of sigma subunit)/PAS domain-containing protein
MADLAARLLHAPAAVVVRRVEAGPEDGAAEWCALVALGGPLVVDDAAADERVSWLPPVASGEVGSMLGVPVTVGEEVVGALCVHGPRPRHWSDSEVDLAQQLAASVAVEVELATFTADPETERVLWQPAIDAAEIGAFDWNLVTGELRWDDRLLRLFGLHRGTFGGTIEDFNASLHPDDVARVTRALRTAIESVGEYAAEYRIILPVGTIRWVTARGRAIPGADGTAVRLVGAAYDTTAVQYDEARVARVLETMPAAFYSLDREWRFRYVNAEAERLLRTTRGVLLGGLVWDLFPQAADSEFERSFRQAVSTGQPVTFEAYYPAPLEAWYQLHAWPQPDGLSVYFLDITARRAAQEEIERTARRSALLARVATELTRTLDPSLGVARLAQVLVPDVADWCLVTLVDDDRPEDWRRRLHDVGWWHRDPSRRPITARYAEARIPSLSDESFVARALASGETIVVNQDACARISAVLAPGRSRELLRELQPSALAVVPLRGRGRIVGLLTVFRDAGSGFDRTDIETLEDVAARAGLALDNARLFVQQRDLAEGLQRILLTTPTATERLEVAALYESAAQAAQVGGDWYDSFVQRDGSPVVVIGDVVGHDTAAAAAMGQVRSALRALAVHTGAGPAELLRGVDEVMHDLHADTTATAVVARLESTDGGELTQLRWSNAGHPPPLLVRADGEVRLLSADPDDPEVDTDLLLGLAPRTKRTESVVDVAPGDTVLLYTDGLVERRDQPVTDGIQALRKTLSALAAETQPLAHLCRSLVVRMLPEGGEDDVALAAVRLRPDLRPGAGAQDASHTSNASNP